MMKIIFQDITNLFRLVRKFTIFLGFSGISLIKSVKIESALECPKMFIIP